MSTSIRKFRPDIEVLRAIAVLAVIISHSKLGLESGFIGVDIFFVISGFLITRHLHDEVQKTGTISLKSFYSRRILRILPLSMLVLLITLFSSLIWLSPLQLINYGWDSLLSSLSGMNYRLAATGTEYFQSTATPSPFQHFWSLAVEEQFYLVWPLVIFVLAKIFVRKQKTGELDPLTRLKKSINIYETSKLGFGAEAVKTELTTPTDWNLKNGEANNVGTIAASTKIDGSKIVINPKLEETKLPHNDRLAALSDSIKSKEVTNSSSDKINSITTTVSSFNLFKYGATIAMLLIIAGSLWLSYVITRESQMWAYFGLHTRAWQLSVGALIAFHLGIFTKIPEKLASVLSWVGLGGLVVGFTFINESTPYPGLWALLPTLATALIVIAGTNLTKWSFEEAFNRSYVRGLAKISYSLYLIHWPVFVMFFYQFGDKIKFYDKVALIIFSLMLSIVSYFTIENPLRFNKTFKSSFKKTYIFGLSLVLIVGGISSATIFVKDTIIKNSKASDLSNSASELEIVKKIDAASKGGELAALLSLPLEKVATDNFKAGVCLANTTVEVPKIEDGCVLGNKESNKTMILVGDSHANQWAETFNQIAIKNQYKLLIYAKSGCPILDITADNPVSKRGYKECYTWRKEALLQIEKLKPEIIIQTGLNYPTSSAEKYKEFLDKLKSISKRVVKIEDTPLPVQNIPECLTRNTKDIYKCSFTLKAGTLQKSKRDMETDIAQTSGVYTVDATNWFCDKINCPAVIDNVIVYQDASHITNTYAKYLSNLMEQKLAPILNK
jgi:peptidoglycan/LPS O-acetylase OafA/YrhL